MFRKALIDLASSRPVAGTGFLMPIPFEALDCYARRYGVSGRFFEAFCYIIRALDEFYLAHFNKQRETSHVSEN